MSIQLALPFPPEVEGDSVDEADGGAAAKVVETPLTPAELEAQIETLTRELVVRAAARWPRARIRLPNIVYRLRGRAAGEACAQKNTTNYNRFLMEKYGEAFVREIVPHEVAHLIVAAICRRRVKPHGEEWRAVMAFFGRAPRVRHEFDAPFARRERRVEYACACDTTHQLTMRAHRRIRRGTRVYSCRVCGEKLVSVPPARRRPAAADATK